MNPLLHGMCQSVYGFVFSRTITLFECIDDYRWDKDSDKCLLIGVFKYGYEKYNLIRADSTLLFLSVCGPPDKAALRKEQLDDE